MVSLKRLVKPSRGLLRRFLPLAAPVSFQYLMLAMVGASDAFMLGRLDQVSMASVSLATQIQFLQNMVVAAIAVGLSILGAQYRGKGDDETVGKVFRIGLRSATLVSLAVAAGCVLAPERLMLLFAAPGPLVERGADYLRIAGFSYLLTGVSQSCHAVLKLTDGARSSACISAFTVVLNVLLNFVLIFGVGFVPGLGVKGAAVATLVARIVEAGLVTRLVAKRRIVPFHFRSLLECYPDLSPCYWRCCLPILGAYVMWSGGLAFYSSAFGHLGGDAAAANAISMVVRDVLSCVADGSAVAVGIIIGKELGAGHLALGRLYGAKALRLSFCLGLACAAVVLLASPMLLKCVVLSDQAGRCLAEMLLVLAAYQVGRCVNTVAVAGIFTAGGDTLFDFYSLGVSMWMVAVPLAFLGAFVFHWPVVLVFACTCIDEVGKIPWTLLHYRRHLWVRNLTREKEAESRS